MGIKDLLRELKPITRNVHISEFQGQTCGIDASAWLHRAAFCCAYELLVNKPTNKYIAFIFKLINALKTFKIQPIFIFDGAQLPMKANEEKRRKNSRQNNKQLAIECYENDDKANGYKYATRAIRITNQMVTTFIKNLKQNNIQFVVAPYEADSQMGYMYKKNQIDFVISEDSDLLLFGVGRVLYKFNNRGGDYSGDYIDINCINEYKISPEVNKKNDLCYYLKKNSSCLLNNLINICVLSGCDYVDRLNGIGIKTAVKHCNEYKNIHRLIQSLIGKKKKNAPKDYEIQFDRAVLAFKHQSVYDIDTKSVLYLNPLKQDNINKYLDKLNKYLKRFKNNNQTNKIDNGDNPSITDVTLDFLGPTIDNHTAQLIANGDIDPRTKQKRRYSVNNASIVRLNGNNGGNGHNDVDDVDDGLDNRFFAKKSNKNTVSNPFGIGIIGKENQTDIKRKGAGIVSRNKRDDRYFGGNNDNNNNNNNGNGFDLDDFLTQYVNPDPEDDGNNKNWMNTEDTCPDALDIDFKENSELVEGDDDDMNIHINCNNKPLQRRTNRKRKRRSIVDSDLDEDDDDIMSITQCKSRRRLNNNNNNNTYTCNQLQTPISTKFKSNFIQKTTPTNIQLLTNKSNNLSKSLISDIYTSSVANNNKKINKRNDINYANSNSNSKKNRNPFSINGGKYNIKQIEIDSDSDDYTDVELIDTKSNDNCILKLTQRNIDSDCLTDDDIDNNKENRIANDFYSDLDDGDDDEDGNNKFSQSSESQSQKQILHVFNQIQLQSNDTGNVIGSDADEDDDDIVILPKHKKFKPKKFKSPRVINPSKAPPKKQNKILENIKNNRNNRNKAMKNGVKKKNKNKGKGGKPKPTQKNTLFGYFSKK